MIKICLPLVSALLSCSSLQAQDPLINILSKELNREFEVLKNQEIPAYFMSYRVTESEIFEISSSHGCLDQSNRMKRRHLTMMIRVGSPEKDNFHPIDEEIRIGPVNRSVEIPFGNDEAAIRQVLWKATHEAYFEAVERFGKIRETTQAVGIPEKVPDFSMEKPSLFYEPQISFPGDKIVEESLSLKIPSYSTKFYNNIFIKNSLVKYTVHQTRNTYVSTEGSKIAENSRKVFLTINAIIGAPDGMELPLSKTYFAFTLKDLPAEEKIREDINGMFAKLMELRKAPVADSYSGPALFSGAVSSLFFHEIVGHRVEASKLKNKNNSQTLKEKIGSPILPKELSLVSDPTLKQFQGFFLSGYYNYDDEGIKSRRVVVIDKGTLLNFLCSRTPVEGFLTSNGHGRASPGYDPVSRPSNLILISEKVITSDGLKKQFINQLKEQNLTFGYFFAEAIPGLNLSGRLAPDAFTIVPTEVYRIYADGRPDELVRGISIAGTPLSVFSGISSAGGEYGTFSTISNGESGGVAVTSVCPMVLINKIELQKRDSGAARNLAR